MVSGWVRSAALCWLLECTFVEKYTCMYSKAYLCCSSIFFAFFRQIVHDRWRRTVLDGQGKEVSCTIFLCICV